MYPYDDPNLFLHINAQRSRIEAADREARFNRWKANLRASSPRFQLKSLLTRIKAARRRVDDLTRSSLWHTPEPLLEDEVSDAARIMNGVSNQPMAKRCKPVRFTRADGTAVIAYGVDPRKGRA